MRREKIRSFFGDAPMHPKQIESFIALRQKKVVLAVIPKPN